MAVLPLRRFTDLPYSGSFLFWDVRHPAAALTDGVVMKKTVLACSLEFETQARKIVSLAFALCESHITAGNNNMSPELKALSAAMLALEKSIDAFIATERLSR